MRKAGRLFAALVFALVTGSANSAITAISIPVGSDDAQSHPFDDNVWSVNNFPADLTNGIGWIVNPTFAAPGSAVNVADLSRHDHVYTLPHIPDSGRAQVTYTFNTPTIVNGVRIVQHQNGVNQMMGEFGSGGPLLPLGLATSPLGLPHTPSAHTEYGVEDFSFGNTTLAGTTFRFTVTDTSLADGWALYRAFPLDASGNVIGVAAIPEPSTYALMLAGLGAIAFVARRRGRSLAVRMV